jgi:aspartyl-tRNA(Asn)/glutamyl-tRNA(Gln) amidotransferase subunit A
VTLAALAGAVRGGELSPREAVQDALDRIERLDPALNSFITVRAEEALAEAKAFGLSTSGPLRGVPVAVKDVIDVAGTPTTAASKVLEDNVPTRDAAVVERLRRAGAIVVGKLNTHEFAFGASTTSAAFGPAHNPWDNERICGGSSGGSGAAVAAGLVTGALGTDTAGSIRIPAALCGVTGIRPTTGRVPNRGVIPVSWTYDTVGPLARTAEDCALLLDAIAGPDPGDASTTTVPAEQCHEGLGRGISGLRIGVVSHLFDEVPLDPRVAAVVETALGELERLGARIERVDARFLRRAEVVQQLVMLPEAAEAHLPWLRTRLADYGPDVRARLLAGLLLPSSAPITGQRARRELAREARPLFDRFDLLASPEMPVVAPRIGEDPIEIAGQTMPYRLSLIPFNSPWSCLGLPTVSVPCGFVDRLPVGLALTGRRLAEATVLRAAHAYQQATDWHEQRPPIAVDADSPEGVYTTQNSEKGE